MAGKLLIVTELGRTAPSTEEEGLNFLRRHGVKVDSVVLVDPKRLREAAKAAKATGDLTAGVVAVLANTRVWQDELGPFIADHPSFFAPEVRQLENRGWIEFRA